MNRHLFLFLIMLFASVNLAFGDTLSNEQAARDLADKIMTKAASGDIVAAFELMKPYAAVSATEVDSAALKSKSEMEKFGAMYGEPIGYEFIDSKKSGESLLRLRYIEKCVKGPLAWVFYFYQTNRGWVMTTVLWNDEGFKGLFDNK